MKVFLPKTIKEPDFFGENYPTLLKKLSYFIMNNKERENEYECVDIIGFIPKEKNKSANSSPTDMQLSESFKRTVGKKGANAAK